MGNDVSTQLILFLQSAELGSVFGVAYDLLRAVRLRRRCCTLLTHVLDALYAAAVLLAIFLFALHRGEGELRLYMLLAMVLGGMAYFAVFGRFLRPLWDFWVDAAAGVVSLLWKPIGVLLRLGKKFLIYIKKLFYFWCKYATIGK